MFDLKKKNINLLILSSKSGVFFWKD